MIRNQSFVFFLKIILSLLVVGLVVFFVAKPNNTIQTSFKNTGIKKSEVRQYNNTTAMKATLNEFAKATKGGVPDSNFTALPASIATNAPQERTISTSTNSFKEILSKFEK